MQSIVWIDTDQVLITHRALVAEIPQIVSGWGFARPFAECIDKTHFNSSRTKSSVAEQAFEGNHTFNLTGGEDDETQPCQVYAQ